MRSSQKLRSRKPKGLTLIELVVVVAVLAILAGFIVPRLGFVRNLAADSGNATTISDSATQAVFYNTAIGHYPQGEDTLIDPTGKTLSNYLNASLASALTTVAIDATSAKSIVAQLDANATSAYLYNAATTTNTTPNSDFTSIVTLTNAGGITLAQVSTVSTQGQAIYQAAYGAANLTSGAPTDGTYLLALGYGTNSQINGKTGLEAPVLFDKIPGEYTRPILLLKVFGTGSAAPGVPPGTSAATSISIGFDGTTTASQLTKYGVDQNR